MAKKFKVGKEQNFLNALITASKKGKSISRKQARTNYKLGNPSATVLRLEQDGWAVHRDYSRIKVRLANGRILYTRTVKYSLD